MGYQPIDCGFHDLLLHVATLRRPVRIAYRNDHDEVVEALDVIEDVYTKNSAEYAQLRGGVTIRLDRLVSVRSLVPSSP